jgi:hypothetical protein
MGGTTTFTVEGVMTAFADKTEYEISFRSMSEAEQKLEVVRLNKGAATGMKGAIKKRKIDVQFKDLVKDKMKDFIIANRTQPAERDVLCCTSN